MVKNTDSGLDDDSDNWHVSDIERDGKSLYPDKSAKEQVYKQVILTDTGFRFNGNYANKVGDKYIYVAIADCTVRFYDENTNSTVTNHTLTRRYGVDPLETDLRKQGIYPLTEQAHLISG